MKISRQVFAIVILGGIASAAFASSFDNMLAKLEKALALLNAADAPTSPHFS